MAVGCVPDLSMREALAPGSRIVAKIVFKPAVETMLP